MVEKKTDSLYSLSKEEVRKRNEITEIQTD